MTFTRDGFRSVAALLAAVMIVGSCTTWKRQADPPGTVVTRKEYDRVRLLLVDQGQVTVYGPAVDGDRLVGWTRAEKSGPRDASYLLANIQAVELSAISKGRTAALVAGLGVTTLLVLAAIAASQPVLSGPIFSSGNQRFSCPLVYSKTETGWRLDSGTFGGAIMRPLRRTDLDNLDFARPRGGVLTLKLANDLDETDFVDALEVLAVDHPPATAVGPSPDGTLHALAALDEPTHARDLSGRDVLSIVRRADSRSWESELRGRDPLSADARDGIELWFRRPPAATAARLVVDAHNTPWASYLLGEFVAAHGAQTASWYAGFEAEPARAVAMQSFLADEAFLKISVFTDTGWVDRGLVWEAGPEVIKRQVIPLDLTGTSGTFVRVRLHAPASFWLVDYVGLDTGIEPTVSVRSLSVRRASRDVIDTLAISDGRELRLETGESVELQFDVPPDEPGSVRSYLVRSRGWYRIHTPEEGEPDLPLLAAVMKPGGIAAASAVRLNAALERLRVEAGAR